MIKEKDLEVLKFLREPHTRYEIARRFGNHYTTTLTYVERLERIGLISTVEEKLWKSNRKVKIYLITPKGEAVLKALSNQGEVKMKRQF